MPKHEEEIFEGKILSRGIGLGTPLFLDTQKFNEESKISESDIEKEVLKYKKALRRSKKQILQIKESLVNDKLSITFDILNTHLEILNDPFINREIENRIRNGNNSIEAVFHEVILDYKNKIKDPFFKEKASDISDVFKRILSNLRSIKADVAKTRGFKSVILSHEIVPSDVFELDERGISALLSLSGSYESHAAILARSKNIPFLSGVDIDKLKDHYFEGIIVDANSGKVIINPTAKTSEKYEQLKKLMLENKDISQEIRFSKQCNFYANISNRNEIDLVFDKNIRGIGLLRTELFFLGGDELPDEEEQFSAYKEIAAKLKNLPFIIRLFDLGADKLFYHLAKVKSHNFFEFRGINYLIKNKGILTRQIKAILRASSFGNIFLLIPFVKELEEILIVKKIILQMQKEMNSPLNNLKVGSMIETPSSVLIIEDIIKIVDFISIGTNDLTRLSSENICSRQSWPALIKSVESVIKAARNNNKPVFLCGEIISDKKILEKFISLGISNFSLGIKHLKNFEKI